MPCSNPNLPGHGLMLLVGLGLIFGALFAGGSYAKNHPYIAPLSICLVKTPETVGGDLNPVAHCGEIHRNELLPAHESCLEMKPPFPDNELLFVCSNLKADQKIPMFYLLDNCQRVIPEFAEPPIAGHAIPATYYRVVNECVSDKKSD
jgi:hypothetical protein